MLGCLRTSQELSGAAEVKIVGDHDLHSNHGLSEGSGSDLFKETHLLAFL